MAANAAAIRAGLATGKAVVVSGPLVGIEIANDAAFEPETFVRHLVQVQVEEWRQRRATSDVPRVHPTRGERKLALSPSGNPESDSRNRDVVFELATEAAHRADELSAQDERISTPLPPEERHPRFRLYLLGVVVGTLVAIVPALVVRLLTWPLRPWLRARAHADYWKHRERREADVARETERLRAAPDDVESRLRRASALSSLRQHAAAEFDLATCLAGEMPGEWRPEVVHRRAEALRCLGLKRLASTEEQRARKLGSVHPFAPTWWLVATATAGIFVLVAALRPEPG